MLYQCPRIPPKSSGLNSQRRLRRARRSFSVGSCRQIPRDRGGVRDDRGGSEWWPTRARWPRRDRSPTSRPARSPTPRHQTRLRTRITSPRFPGLPRVEIAGTTTGAWDLGGTYAVRISDTAGRPLAGADVLLYARAWPTAPCKVFRSTPALSPRNIPGDGAGRLCAGRPSGRYNDERQAGRDPLEPLGWRHVPCGPRSRRVLAVSCVPDRKEGMRERLIRHAADQRDTVRLVERQRMPSRTGGHVRRRHASSPSAQ